MKKIIIVSLLLVLLGCRGTTKGTGDHELNKYEDYDKYFLYIQYGYRLDLVDEMIDHIIETSARNPTRDSIFIHPSSFYIEFKVHEGTPQRRLNE
jgi:hypothetical protein